MVCCRTCRHFETMVQHTSDFDDVVGICHLDDYLMDEYQVQIGDCGAYEMDVNDSKRECDEA